MQAKNSGFTLMEVNGVLAVIAIIAAVATPQIFQAIQDAKVTSLVQEANDLKAAVARYYKDTGTWPRHIPTRNEDHFNQLMRNSDSRGNAIAGWNGPYIESQLSNPITPGGYLDLQVTSNANYACDLDGDGNGDGTFITYRIDGVPDNLAQNISQMLDKDGANTTGDEAWQAAGRVKRYGGNHASILVMCLARV
ncbi:MAG: prepilin-type N-terminal cleavage/methylation domain-containing protein [Pseudomonadales bacterium]|jgi:type II secretory pathway pseudopilin PulG|nr:prepilin-type N-terminal cleavage/methylation domain-containing protein [Pseudomonadales bacterium]